jgi:phage terminase large subunit-like protein
VRLSCPDWIDRLKSRRSLVPDLPLDLAEGNRAVAIFNKLRLADVPGTPTMAEAGGDWFRDIVRALFGSLDPATRTRMIRELFLLVPKKNSKTTNGALLMTTALLMNERPYAPMVMTAPVQDVADVAFAAAAGAIALDEVLRKRLHVREHLKTIIDRETKADLRIMTFDPSVLTGQKFVAALIDELHVVAKMAKAASAIRQVRGGMLPFAEAFLAFITTQSEEAPAGVFRAELMKARAIRDGKQDGAMLPVLYELPPEIQRDKNAAWKDPALWTLVTPNAGRSISIPRLVEEMKTAEATSEAELRAWASQHLNLEIGLALMSDSWAGASFWEAQALDEGLTLEQLLERSEVATVGIDGGGLDDLLGLAVIGRERVTGNWLVWTRAWAHKIVLERRKEVAQQLLDFEAARELTIVENIGEDIEELADLVEQVHASGLLDRDDDEDEEKQVPAIGVDPVGIGAIVSAIVERKVPQGKIIGISQGWKMAGPIKTTERKLAEGTLLHGGQLLMAWCVGNAKVEPRGNAVIITKQTSGTAKIDPLMAMFDAVHLMALNPEAGGKSFWEESPEPSRPPSADVCTPPPA